MECWELELMCGTAWEGVARAAIMKTWYVLALAGGIAFTAYHRPLRTTLVSRSHKRTWGVDLIESCKGLKGAFTPRNGLGYS